MNDDDPNIAILKNLFDPMVPEKQFRPWLRRGGLIRMAPGGDIYSYSGEAAICKVKLCWEKLKWGTIIILFAHLFI